MYNSSPETRSENGGDVPVIVILSGPRRGRNEVLDQKTYRIVMDPDEALYVLPPDGKRTENYHATLHRVANTYELEVAPDHNIWVNGEQVKESQALKSGDMLEIGHTGPVVRYRIYHKGEAPWKTLAEALADSMNGASADGKTSLGKMSRFLSNAIRDIATQTTLWFRFWVLIVLTILIVSVVMLIAEHMQLQKRIAVEDIRIGSIEEKLEQEEVNGLTRQDLLALQSEVESQLADTMERLKVLEAGTGKASQLIAAATPSVTFLLGAYGYMEPGTGRLFRYVESGGGKSTRYTLEEEGAVLELMFTGTAFGGALA